MTVNGGEINDTMDNAILPGRWTVAVPGNDLSNPPELRNPATLWGFLDVYLQADGQWIMQVFSPSGTSEDAGYVYVRKNINSAGWTNWYRFATATSPQEYDIPLTEGISGTAKYFKIQENVVSIILSDINKSQWVSNETIGVLPEGFRPKEVLTFSANVGDGAATIGGCGIRINTNGIITVVGYAVIGGIGISSMCMFISS